MLSDNIHLVLNNLPSLVFNQDICKSHPHPSSPAISGDSGAGAAQHPVGSGPPWKGNFPGQRQQAPDSPSHLKEVPCSTNHTLDLYTTQKGLIRVYNQSLQKLYFNGLHFSPLQLFSNSSCPSFGRAADLVYNQIQHGVFSDVQAARNCLVMKKLLPSSPKSYLVLTSTPLAAKGAVGTAALSGCTSRAPSLTYSPNSLHSTSDVQSPPCNKRKARSHHRVFYCKN